MPSRSIRNGAGPAALGTSPPLAFLTPRAGGGNGSGVGVFGGPPPIPLGLGTNGDGSSADNVTRKGRMARGKPRSKYSES